MPSLLSPLCPGSRHVCLLCPKDDTVQRRRKGHSHPWPDLSPLLLLNARALGLWWPKNTHLFPGRWAQTHTHTRTHWFRCANRRNKTYLPNAAILSVSCIAAFFSSLMDIGVLVDICFLCLEKQQQRDKSTWCLSESLLNWSCYVLC